MAEDVQPSRNTPHVGEPLTDRLKGGLIVTVIALLLFMATFYVSSPTVPRVMTILTAVVGVAVIAGLVPIRGPQDFYGGLALVLLGTFALIASAELPGQRGFAFGPGTAPRLFAIILAVIGAAVALIGAFSDGPQDREVQDPRTRAGHHRHLALCRAHPPVRAGRCDLPCLHDLDHGIEGNAMGREPDRGGGDDLGMRAAVRLPLEPAVPALAAGERTAAVVQPVRGICSRASSRLSRSSFPV